MLFKIVNHIKNKESDEILVIYSMCENTVIHMMACNMDQQKD